MSIVFLLLISGSHDSGGYELSIDKGLSPDRKWEGISRLIQISTKTTGKFLLKWFQTQHVSITDQLANGIRYFDLRVAPYTDGELYFVHGFYGGKIIDLLAQMRIFLKENPKEVVLIDFQHLHELDQDQHFVFVEELKYFFAKMICPFAKHKNLSELTLEDLAAKGYQVIMFYGDDEIAGRFVELWPRSMIPNDWPNTESPKKLKPFLWNGLVNRDPNTFFVSQSILSPKKTTIITHPTKDLFSHLSEKCNRHIGKWIKDVKKTKFKPNIIMIDHIDFNNFLLPKMIILLNYEYVDYSD